MYKLITTTLLVFVAFSAMAQSQHKISSNQHTAFFNNVGLDKREISEIGLNKLSKAKAQAIAKADDEEVNFIFDPEGTEKMYCMSLYSYSQSQGSFQNASSLKSQVRYAADGKTVYFKDLTKSLGVKTWLKGEIDGDTIRVPYGQPLVYYKGQYLVFFVPMKYSDATGKLEPLDELKLIVRGDSLCSPQYDEEGSFQATCGYVYVSEETQGFLSLDLDQQMALITRPFVDVPDDIEPVEYVMSYENSRGNITKTKVNVKQRDNDIYMQLSTSAPDEYIHGTIQGNDIAIPNYQVVTDSTFIYFYALADAVYEGEEMTDFVTTDSLGHLSWDAATRSISAGKDVLGVDYMDDLYRCMNYTISPQLTVYAGNHIAKPKAPELWVTSLDGYMPYISFKIINEDVDGNYINTDSIYYCLYFDGEQYTFTHDEYVNVKEDMVEVPYSFSDGFDFYGYGTLRYVYLYEELYSTIGIQTIYSVDGKKKYSDIVQVDKESGEATTITVEDPDRINDITTLKENTGIYNLSGQKVSSMQKGIYIFNGKKIIK